MKYLIPAILLIGMSIGLPVIIKSLFIQFDWFLFVLSIIYLIVMIAIIQYLKTNSQN